MGLCESFDLQPRTLFYQLRTSIRCSADSVPRRQRELHRYLGGRTRLGQERITLHSGVRGKGLSLKRCTSMQREA